MNTTGTHAPSATCYRLGCRQPPCCAAATHSCKRWRVSYARNHGPLRIPATQTRQQLADLHNRGLTNRQIAAHTRLHPNIISRIRTGRAPRIHQTTAAAIHHLWNDHCAPLEPDRRTWPTQPLRHAIERHYGSLKASGQPHIARAINRHPHLTTNRAETYTDQLGWLAVDVWPDWYQQAEKGPA